MEGGLLLLEGGKEVVLVEFADHLAFMYDIAHIDGKFLDNAARLAFDFDLGHGLYFSCGYDRANDIHSFDFG